jgi:hypothetical protein
MEKIKIEKRKQKSEKKILLQMLQQLARGQGKAK